jgi:hypothetical protein
MQWTDQATSTTLLLSTMGTNNRKRSKSEDKNSIVSTKKFPPILLPTNVYLPQRKRIDP